MNYITLNIHYPKIAIGLTLRFRIDELRKATFRLNDKNNQETIKVLLPSGATTFNIDENDYLERL